MQQGKKMSYYQRWWAVQHESELGMPKAPEAETSAENTSPESEIAFIPVLYTVFF